MKKFLVILLAVAMLVLNCVVAVAENEPLHFYYFASHIENEFNVSLVAAVQAEADAQGVELTVVSASNDPAKQNSQIDAAIAQGDIDGAMLQACSADGVTAGVMALQQAGIPTITMHEAIADQSLVTSYVGPDLPTIGLIVMEHVCEELNGEGDIAILIGVLGNSVEAAIENSYNTILEKYPNINVVFKDTANWMTDQALSKVETWLSSGKSFETIVAMNDSMAIGALQAVKGAGMVGQIKIYGSDATAEAVAAVKAGEMTGTVFFDVNAEGAAAVDTLIAAAKGENIDAEVLMPPILVNDENINELFPED